MRPGHLLTIARNERRFCGYSFWHRTGKYEMKSSSMCKSSEQEQAWANMSTISCSGVSRREEHLLYTTPQVNGSVNLVADFSYNCRYHVQTYGNFQFVNVLCKQEMAIFFQKPSHDTYSADTIFYRIVSVLCILATIDSVCETGNRRDSQSDTVS